MDVGQMDLDHRNPDGQNGVSNGHARMRVGGWIENQEVSPSPLLLNIINQLPFVVRLKKLHRVPLLLRTLLQPLIDVH
jgi:hypothetical protein